MPNAPEAPSEKALRQKYPANTLTTDTHCRTTAASAEVVRHFFTLTNLPARKLGATGRLGILRQCAS